MSSSADNQLLEALAEPCFSYLISDPDELKRFMDFAGYDGATIRAALGTTSLWTGLADYFAHNESALKAMCALSSFTPETFVKRWRALNRHD